MVTLAKDGIDHTNLSMATKLKTEIIAAAIAGFEQQKDSRVKPSFTKC
jgi:hypothetical protein